MQSLRDTCHSGVTRLETACSARIAACASAVAVTRAAWSSLSASASSFASTVADARPAWLLPAPERKKLLRNQPGSPPGSVFWAHRSRSQSPVATRFMVSSQSSSS